MATNAGRGFLHGSIVAVLIAGCAPHPPPSVEGRAEPAVAAFVPGTFAEATRDDLTVHRGAGDPTVVSTLFAGEWLMVVGAPTEIDGTAWLRIQYGGGGFGWIGVDPDDPPLEPAEPSCPEGPADRAIEVGEVVSLTIAERLSCFGDETLTLSPVTWRTLVSDSPYGGDPDWLADDAALNLYGRGGWEREESLPAHLDPDARIVLGDEAAWLSIRGRFDHPTAGSCRRDVDIRGMGIVDQDAFLADLAPMEREDGVLWCRQQFVVTDVAPIAAPPPLIDPVATPAGGAWRAMADAPILGRSQYGAAWTGSELVVWGGWATAGEATGHAFFAAADGAAYDPAADTWRAIAAAPIRGRTSPELAWTGRELLVIGGFDDAFAPLGDGAAYDPQTDTWRPIAPMPPEIAGGHATWTGSELIALSANGQFGAAYEPGADTWRALPVPPLPNDVWGAGMVWTGDEVIAIALPNGVSATAAGAAWDPATNEWHELPESPVVALNSGPPVWIGSELLIISRSLSTGPPEAVPPDTTYVSLYDPETERWRTAGVQDVYLPIGADTWTGELLITGDAAYDPAADEWLALPSRPPREGSTPVWSGEELLIWGGGGAGESMIHELDGFAYAPDER